MKKEASFKYLKKNISSIKNKCQDGFPPLKEGIRQIIKIMDNILLVTLGLGWMLGWVGLGLKFNPAS